MNGARYRVVTIATDLETAKEAKEAIMSAGLRGTAVEVEAVVDP